jgi:hypothetical protein
VRNPDAGVSVSRFEDRAAPAAGSCIVQRREIVARPLTASNGTEAFIFAIATVRWARGLHRH